MYVSYLVNKVDKNKEQIQILNCSTNKEKLWTLLQETASKYKGELNEKSDLKNLELIEDPHNHAIKIKATLVTQVKGLLWSSTEDLEITVVTLVIQETDDNVHVNKSIDSTLFSELQNKLKQRRKVIETDIE